MQERNFRRTFRKRSFRNFEKNHLDMNQIEALVSIDLKKEEPAVVSLAEKYKVPFLTYSAEMLNEVEEVSSASSFVKK